MGSDERAVLAAQASLYGVDDLPAVKELQAGLKLSPRGDAGRGLPQPSAAVSEDIRFFEQLRAWMQTFPPAARDVDYQQRYEPLGAFWSVTMYDTPSFYVVANPIGRYSIGDRTPGLHRAGEGSLTIVMQEKEPSTPEERANWLPIASPTSFRPSTRNRTVMIAALWTPIHVLRSWSMTLAFVPIVR